jgi:hypothetical protein
VAHFRQDLLNASSGNRCGTAGGAGMDATFHGSGHTRHNNSGGQAGEEGRADRCGSTIRHEKKKQGDLEARFCFLSSGINIKHLVTCFYINETNS